MHCIFLPIPLFCDQTDTSDGRQRRRRPASCRRAATSLAGTDQDVRDAIDSDGRHLDDQRHRSLPGRARRPPSFTAAAVDTASRQHARQIQTAQMERHRVDPSVSRLPATVYSGGPIFLLTRMTYMHVQTDLWRKRRIATRSGGLFIQKNSKTANYQPNTD